MDIRPLLAALQSPDPAVRKPAEARVSSLESAPGFLEALHAAGAPGSGLDEGARVLATICCKNIVVRHWRRSRIRAVLAGDSHDRAADLVQREAVRGVPDALEGHVGFSEVEGDRRASAREHRR